MKHQDFEISKSNNADLSRTESEVTSRRSSASTDDVMGNCFLKLSGGNMTIAVTKPYAIPDYGE